MTNAAVPPQLGLAVPGICTFANLIGVYVIGVYEKFRLLSGQCSPLPKGINRKAFAATVITYLTLTVQIGSLSTPAVPTRHKEKEYP